MQEYVELKPSFSKERYVDEPIIAGCSMEAVESGYRIAFRCPLLDCEVEIDSIPCIDDLGFAVEELKATCPRLGN